MGVMRRNITAAHHVMLSIRCWSDRSMQRMCDNPAENRASLEIDVRFVTRINTVEDRQFSDFAA